MKNREESKRLGHLKETRGVKEGGHVISFQELTLSLEESDLSLIQENSCPTASRNALSN